MVDSSAALVAYDPTWAPILESTNGLDMATGLPTTDVFIRFTNAATDLIFTNGLRALTGATNRTYGEHLDWIEDRKAKRRNE